MVTVRGQSIPTITVYGDPNESCTLETLRLTLSDEADGWAEKLGIAPFLPHNLVVSRPDFLFGAPSFSFNNGGPLSIVFGIIHDKAAPVAGDDEPDAACGDPSPPRKPARIFGGLMMAVGSD